MHYGGCYPGISPDRVTPDPMKLTAWLGSMMPYRQAAKALAEFLPIEATVSTIRIGQRLDEQIARETEHARS